jgi:hypothetical protein
MHSWLICQNRHTNTEDLDPLRVALLATGRGSTVQVDASPELSSSMSWAWSYITFQRGTRLITGLSGSRMENMPMPVPMDPSTQSRQAA